MIERLQIKDTLSDTSVNKLVKQVAQGKYRSVKLVGTEETAERVNAALGKAGLSKRMSSSGISSDTTTKMAQRAGATGSGSLGGAVATAARNGGAAGAAIGAGIAVVKGIGDLADGSKELNEVAVDVGCAAAKGGVTGAGASAAGVAAGAATVAGLEALAVTGTVATTATVLLPVAAAVGAGWIISSLWDFIFD